MMRPSTRFVLAVITLLLPVYLLSEKSAYAYLDPGSGSFIFQVLVGMGLLLLSGWKIFLSAIKRLFERVFRKKK